MVFVMDKQRRDDPAAVKIYRYRLLMRVAETMRGLMRVEGRPEVEAAIKEECAAREGDLFEGLSEFPKWSEREARLDATVRATVDGLFARLGNGNGF